MRPRPPTIATLMYDSECGPRSVGARSLVRWRRRLIYGVGGIEVDLEIGPSRGAGYLRLLGQVTTGAPGSVVVWVSTDGPTGRVQVEADEVGQFTFDRLLAADYRVTVILSHRVIALPWVPVRPRFPFDHADLATALGLTVPPDHSGTPTDPT